MRGLHIDPTQNKVGDARISVDTAAFVARSFGFKVAGYEPPDEDR